MRMSLVIVIVFWSCVFSLAVRLLATADSPPAAYASVLLAAGAAGALVLSLLIIWLTGI